MLPEEQKGYHHMGLQNAVAARRLGALLMHLFSDEDSISEDPDRENDQLKRGTSFHYPRLSEEEKTRILILEPGKFGDELKGSLKHIRSLQDHDYEALSYVWGDGLGSHSLTCSGMEIQITANLNAALQTLRFSDKPRTLWVDAICINQKDVIERGRQVRNMQEIYSNARQVLVWLGEAAQNDALAFDSLRRLQYQLLDQVSFLFIVRLGWYRNISGRVFSGGSYRSIITDIEYDHLISLLYRDWFRRTWVIQEVASARNATVYCGNESMPWETFAEVFMRLGDHFIPFSQSGGQELHHSLENIAAIETARRSHSGPLSMSLFHILVATSFSNCKDKRDKIFAVVGLAKDWLGKKTLVPDYDTTVDKFFEVFKDFAVADSNQNKDLRTLSCASGPSETPSLPSWVPDWTNIQNAHPFVRYSDRTKFSASGGMNAVAWHSHKETILHVSGKHVDSIASLGSEPEFTKAVAIFEINQSKISELKTSFRWLQECQDLARDENGVLSNSRHEMLWRTLMCGLTGEAFPVHGRYSNYFIKYMEFMESAAERFEEYLNESKTSTIEIRVVDETIPYFKTHALIEASLFKWASRRRFCTTTCGRLACVPKNSKEGDIICTLFGAEVPYVLRPVEEGFYSVIGECYVDDIMHGESLSHGTLSREFRLC